MMSITEEIVSPAILKAVNSKAGMKFLDLVLAKYYRKKEYLDTLMRAKARRDAKAIEDGRMDFDGKELIPALALPNIQPVAVPLMAGIEEEAYNLNANLAIAADILKDIPDNQVSDEPVNPDWFARWRREARVIGDEEMRGLWGRILAEEIKKPQTFSYKTLDVLKNVTPYDAKIFCNIVNFNINGLIFENSKNFFPYTLDEILRMQFLDLINDDSNLRPFANKEGSRGSFFMRGHDIAFKIEGMEETLVLTSTKGWAISVAGKEILNIPGAVPAISSEQIRLLGNYVWEHLPQTCSTMAICLRLPSGEYQLDQHIAVWHR